MNSIPLSSLARKFRTAVFLLLLVGGISSAMSEDSLLLFDYLPKDLPSNEDGPVAELVTDPVKVGDQSLSINVSKFVWLPFKLDSADLTAYNTLHFWAYSSEISDASVLIQVTSPNFDGDEVATDEMRNFYRYILKNDFTGWQEFNINFEDMTAVGKPAGWDKIQTFGIQVGGWGIEPSPGAKVIINDLKFIKMN